MRYLLALIFPIVVFITDTLAAPGDKTYSHNNFVRTGTYTYQYLSTAETEPSIQIVIPGEGIFISAQTSDNKLSLAQFDPAKLNPKSSWSMFINFDGKYYAISTPKGTFSLKGAAYFEFPQTGLFIYIDGSRKFCGILKEANTSRSTLLAIVNNEVIGTVSDPEMINILLQKGASKTVGEYLVATDGSITLNNSLVTPSELIGLSIHNSHNPCRRKDVKFVNNSAYSQILSQTNMEAAKKVLEKAFLKENPLKSVIIVQEDRERIIGFDVNSKDIVDVRPRGASLTLCTIQRVKY